MSKIFKYSFLLLCIGSCFFSCAKEVIENETCVEEAIFRGIDICYWENPNAAAIELTNSNSQYLILSNFFEMVDSNAIELGDQLLIDFVEVDMTPSPALCGALIVAPVTEMTCASLVD